MCNRCPIPLNGKYFIMYKDDRGRQQLSTQKTAASAANPPDQPKGPQAMNIMAEKVLSGWAKKGGEEFLPFLRLLVQCFTSEGRGCFHSPPFPGEDVCSSQPPLTGGLSLIK